MVDVDIDVADVVEGRLGDDVMDACAWSEKVDERLPLEQMAREDFFRSMFNNSIGSFWCTMRVEHLCMSDERLYLEV